MTGEVRPLVEINQQALRVLYRELGLVDSVRFLKQFTVGLGDYVQERDEIFADKTLADVVREIKQRSSS